MNTAFLNRERLRLCREQMGITKQEAAKLMNMSQPAYLRYESGERAPSIHVIQSMANVLNTSVEYLLGQTDSASPNCYIVNVQDDPALFQLIEAYKNSDISQKERLVKYATDMNSCQ